MTRQSASSVRVALQPEMENSSGIVGIKVSEENGCDRTT